MSKKVWNDDAISIIILPSGSQGEKILDLALQWSRSWLLTPALWMMADDIPEFDPTVDISLQIPPNLSAFLLGRDLDQNPVKEQVDVFWTLGSQPFSIIRFIAVRTEQDPELMHRTNLAAETAAKFVERAVPAALDRFKKYNLIIAPTNERRLLEGVLSTYWDANLIAAAEDRATPVSSDSFVKIEERFTGFALAHIATTAGLWAGLPIGSAELGPKNQLVQARLQRVFVRGVTSDALSADVAHWALDKLNHQDTSFELGLVDGRNVTTIAAEYQDLYMDKLVDYIMKGPVNAENRDNFLYTPFEESLYAPMKESWFKKLLTRIQDMGEGIAALPRWIGASAEYRLEFAIDDEADEDILYRAVPARLAPKIKLPPVDVLVASLKPKLPMPQPDLWKHMRESISSAIDAPPTLSHPKVLIDDKDNRLLVFATVGQVLPDPGKSWSGDKYIDGTKVLFEPISWLDAATAQVVTQRLHERIDELAPGIIDAREQLSETQKLVDEAVVELNTVSEDLDLIQTELESDKRFSSKVKGDHTHKLPRAITDKAKRKSEGGSSSGGTKSGKSGQVISTATTYDANSAAGGGKSVWRRIFSRKGRGKK